MHRTQTTKAFVLTAGLLALSGPIFAQDGRVEAAGFGGAKWLSGGIGTNYSAGGAAAFRVTDNLRIFGEFGYSPLSSIEGLTGSAVSSLTGYQVSTKVKLYDIGGGIDYSFGSSKVRPYVLAAFGVGRLEVSANVSGVGSGSAGTNSAYFATGGGARIYVGHNWGFKPEVRIQRYGGTIASTAADFTGGIFFQFGGN
jgi:hypothetical protein